ncbi:hypothetical protein M422DRAFT_261912 [Sphaerobolus stellatus SS14]|uniref:RNA-dependent RNA polymerase n=1 Tax=Sphaerobolus stellatus (strain SS14) TaxID=990650 RepID=A0A0C9VDQ5_SPHS4|nr:hypothetical protein M422DRAFT_261912 [Sphaerobolus stellatus SS14]
MVAVDSRLEGVRMRLRPSMKVILSSLRLRGHSNILGLNYSSPLIQALEDLGVGHRAFLELQSAAVADIQAARQSLPNFAGLLDGHALGRSYSLAYLMRSLDGIGCDFEHHDPNRAVGTPFVRSLVDTAILSVLRGLKHNARIPVPNSWNLVGIADESLELDPGGIYACVWELDVEIPVWLQGSTMIYRSPTIHLGDVQMVTAVKPPIGSIYRDHPMANVVIFSYKGKRDPASCLGGGDLDGDLYLVCQYPILIVSRDRVHAPGDYPATKHKDIGRPSTIADVADFYVKSINSGIVGLLSTNHLILSDQSSFGTFDHDCLKLAELCSKAVDHPKSGISVDMKEIPRFPIPYKPDWKSDENLNPRKTNYYESSRANGHLFRAIKLEGNTQELSFDSRMATLKDKPKDMQAQAPPPIDAITLTLESIVEEYL